MPVRSQCDAMQRVLDRPGEWMAVPDMEGVSAIPNLGSRAPAAIGRPIKL